QTPTALQQMYYCAGVVCLFSVIFPKPNISISPAGEVTWGQNIGIICSISTQTLGGTFILMKTSDSFNRTQNSNTNSATFNIPEVDFDDEGLYQCQYQESGPSQQFYSPTSDSVRLSVTGKKTNTSKLVWIQAAGQGCCDVSADQLLEAFHYHWGECHRSVVIQAGDVGLLRQGDYGGGLQAEWDSRLCEGFVENPGEDPSLHHFYTDRNIAPPATLACL
uniref:Ig-like domain-containing protein n=1 Tax=Maylandia zebra TaxID=106582 RepID=A0A3P9DKT6_9CICH